MSAAPLLWPVRLVAIGVIAITAWKARLPVPSTGEIEALSRTFAFDRKELPGTGAEHFRTSYIVNRNAQSIAGWMSASGTSLAFGDLDEDGLSNDLCRTEPATNETVIAPAPGTGDRYRPFALDDTVARDRDSKVPVRCRFGDFNEDGLSDVAVFYWGAPPQLFLRTTPAEGAGYVPDATSFRQQRLVGHDDLWWTMAAAFTDIDGDGHADLILGNYFPDGEELIGPDADGPIEMHASFSNAQNAGYTRVFLWEQGTAGAEPSARYREIPNPFPDNDATAWTLAIGAADLDRDGLSDLYVANDFGPDHLYLNKSTPGNVKLAKLKGTRDFTTPTSRVLGRDSFKGMGVDFGDINDDGVFDMFVSNLTVGRGLGESHFLFVSNDRWGEVGQGVAPFYDLGEELGVSRSSWGWDNRFGDFDNDGDLELLQATGFLEGSPRRWADLAEIAMANDLVTPYVAAWPNIGVTDQLTDDDVDPFYVRGPSGRYVDISSKVGTADGWNCRGIAAADVDGDGKLDLAFANQWEPSYLLHNRSPAQGAWLGLHLVLPVTPSAETTLAAGHPAGPAAGYPAYDARAIVTLPDGRKLVRQVDGGNGGDAVSGPEIHFGLGDVPADKPLPVELHWRDPAGKIHTTTLSIQPGWHTVSLASLSGAN